MFLYSSMYITDTTSELESNPKYISFPNSAKIEFHYKSHPNAFVDAEPEQDIGFTALEDIKGPEIEYKYDKPSVDHYIDFLRSVGTVVDKYAKTQKKN